MITNPMIIGNKYTPVREVVDAAARKCQAERSCFAMVVKGHDWPGLYYGTPEEAWSEAADLSNKLHITYVDKPFQLVLSCAPRCMKTSGRGASACTSSSLSSRTAES